jgi:hypothetical protein
VQAGGIAFGCNLNIEVRLTDVVGSRLVGQVHIAWPTVRARVCKCVCMRKW